MAFQTKYLKISKMITEQDDHADLNQAIEGLIDNLKLDSKMIKGWVLQLDYREDNPAYNTPIGNRAGKNKDEVTK